MAALLLIAFIGVMQVLGQVVHSTGSFDYQGCANIEPSFGAPVTISDGRLTPEACQTACQGHQVAALTPDACRCGNDPKAIHPIDESKCDYACMGDHNAGLCGSLCPDNAPKIANIYTRVIASANDPGSGGPPASYVSPKSSDTTCSSSGSSTPAPATQTARITPVGPAPEVPTAASSSSCSSEGNFGGPGTPAPPAESSHILPTNAPEPGVYSKPAQQEPQTTPSQAPPGYAPDCGPSSLRPYSGDAGQQATAEPDCKSPGGSDLSPVVSETTLWPKPSSSRSIRSLPVPSQVPGSDSTHRFIPPLLSIGGLALVAVVIM